MSVLSLYRSCLHQIKRLPHVYLRQFFRLKTADDVRAILRSKNDSLRNRKTKRMSKDLRKLEAANNGSTKAFAHVLDLAYGRKGKLRWEIMKPLLSDPNAQKPPLIIHAVEKSRPPVYSPELKALLTSDHSRSTKALNPKSLAFPPTLPARAVPFSDEARLLGPFSRRREVNIRWRYFTTEWKKVRPPLEVVTKGSSKIDTERAGIRGFGMQGQGVFEDIETIVGPPWIPQDPARRERQTTNVVPEPSTAHNMRHPSRWLRRRYQELLGRLPILTFSLYQERKDGRAGSYTVSLSPSALSPSVRYTTSRLAEIGAIDDRAWLEFARKKADSQTIVERYDK